MKLNELIPPDAILPMMQAKSEMLYSAISTLTRRTKNALSGRLRLARRKNTVHFFRVTDDSCEWGDYLPASKIATIKSLVQKDYDRKALIELQRELSLVDGFIRTFRPERIDEIFEKLGPERRALAEPLRLSDEVYTERWLSVKYAGKPFAVDALQLFTSRGERVRSKSEVIIAETLERLCVPYRYEFPLELKVRGYGCVDRKGVRGESCASRHSVKFYPDFTCLNLRTRREFIWEHFGLMSDTEYAASAVEKLEIYCDNGIFLGDGLLITMETLERPLNSATAEAIAKHFLL